MTDIGTLAIHHLTLHDWFLAIVFSCDETQCLRIFNMFKTLRRAAIPSDCYNRDRRNRRGSKAGVPLLDYLMVWRIGWKIEGEIGQWERTIGRSDAILKNRMESEVLWHVRLERVDRIRLVISVIARNALWDKHNENRIRSVGQWERKIGWDLSKHESHPITFVNTNAIKLFKIGQWDAGLTLRDVVTAS